MTDDIAYTQKLSRHRNTFVMYDSKPVVDFGFVAPNSTLIGEVTVHPYASIWYNATLRAEMNPVRVGSYSSIGDATSIFTASALPTGVPASVTIGNNVTIQNNCTIYSSIIDDEVFIGSGSIIGEGCKIEKGAVIAPNSYIPPGRLIPGRQLWSGNPAKYVRDITEEEAYSNYVQTLNIWNNAQKHLNIHNKAGEENSDEVDPESLIATYLNENYHAYRTKYTF